MNLLQEERISRVGMRVAGFEEVEEEPGRNR